MGIEGITKKDLVSPLALAHFWGGEKYYQWQSAIINDLWEDGSRVIVTTPNEVGKTSVIIADTGLSFMSAFPGAQIVSTAGSFRQVSEQLWPVVKSKVSRYPDWKITDEKLTAPSINGLRPSTWTIFSTDDAKKAEGYHAQSGEDLDGERVKYPLVYIIDEAKGVSKGIFEAMYRCDPDHVLITSSPGEKTGAFYDLVDAIKRGVMDDWKLHQITWSDNPHLLRGRKRTMRDNLIKMYGVNHPFIQSMIFGNFFEARANNIFRLESIKVAMSGALPLMQGHRTGAADLSGGGDELVFGVREGNAMVHMDMIVEKDTAVSGRWLEDKFKQFDLTPHDLIIDEGGLGQPIVDELEYRGWGGINRYNFNDKPKDNVKYDSRGMEDHHRLAMMMDGDEILLLNDEVLSNQMVRRKYRMPNKGGNKMTLESKKDYRKRWDSSPDRLDMTIMLFSNFNRPTPFRLQDKRHSRLMDKYNKMQSGAGRQSITGIRALLGGGNR